MKLKLNQSEIQMLTKVYPTFDINIEYDEDKIIELYELIYDEEALYANVTKLDKEYEEYMKLAREYSLLGDKLQDLVEGK